MIIFYLWIRICSVAVPKLSQTALCLICNIWGCLPITLFNKRVSERFSTAWRGHIRPDMLLKCIHVFSQDYPPLQRRTSPAAHLLPVPVSDSSCFQFPNFLFLLWLLEKKNALGFTFFQTLEPKLARSQVTELTDAFKFQLWSNGSCFSPRWRSDIRLFSLHFDCPSSCLVFSDLYRLWGRYMAQRATASHLSFMTILSLQAAYIVQ